jgi:nitrogen fixation protein NifU and related proteins
MSLRELYQEMIVDHGKTPRNFGKLDTANHSHVGHNPLCGDRLMLYIKENKGVIEDCRFEGAGCAISVASASLMTETVKGKTLAEVNDFFTHFHSLVTTGQEPEFELGKLTIFGGVAEFPIRVKCATLAWHTLNAALAHDPNPASTE